MERKSEDEDTQTQNQTDGLSHSCPAKSDIFFAVFVHFFFFIAVTLSHTQTQTITDYTKAHPQLTSDCSFVQVVHKFKGMLMQKR
jgi:hypothetical protein